MQPRLVDPVPGMPGDAAGEPYWQAFAGARTAEQLCQAWLPILCGMIPSARTGVLLLQDKDGSYAPAAVWPGSADPAPLGDIAKAALNKREGVVQTPRKGQTQLAYPLAGADQPPGVVVLDLLGADDAAVTRAMRLTHWGAGWLADLFNRRALSHYDQRLDRSAFLFDLSMAALLEEDFRKAAMSVVNRLAQRFNCHQVQLGLEKGQSVEVVAMSHSAWFDDKANLVNLAASAMNEAFDQRARIVIPEPEGGPLLITVAHQKYARECGVASLCSLPLEAGNAVVGVWLLQRDDPFSEDELDFLETLSLALGPVLALKRGAEEGLAVHARRSWQRTMMRVTDASRPGRKAIGILLALLLVFLALYETDYRVSSEALVEGAVQRVAVAPYQGYIREAPARAGDLVRKGQRLAVLEDKDLNLERVRWEAELEVSQRKEREAMANADRVALRLASAQSNQARAQLDLVLEKLNRVQIIAPVDGVVVRGDLSQRLGSPVEQGEVLFELAPLDAWRVIVKVDERDIAHVQEGKPGELVLTSLPGQSFPFKVKKVTPVSVAEEGRNYFRVEADLHRGAPKLRPGMEGVAKVTVGEKRLLWIWTHRVTDWLRLFVWKWMP